VVGCHAALQLSKAWLIGFKVSAGQLLMEELSARRVVDFQVDPGVNESDSRY